MEIRLDMTELFCIMERMTERTSKKWCYTQSIEILDLAWDRYMELSLTEAPEGAPGMVALAHMKVDNPTLSRLFDIAITAYREAKEHE